MEFNDLIEKRRSIRKFDSNKKVSKEILYRLVESAIQAPSWKNSQTGRYHCIIDETLLAQFKAECLPEFNQNNTAGATAMVVTTFVKNRSGFNIDGDAMNELGNGWGCYDLGLQNMNFILEAKNQGLDTLILGIRNTDKIQAMLNIPKTETVVSVIAVGYGAKEATKPKRKKADEITTIY